jgi:dimethylsulfoniopropionate demethylase
MTLPFLAISRRTRSTPFSARVSAAGVKAYTVYNHMLLPAAFESLESDYRHLKDHVQIWDVACERQVQVEGPDAARLVQMLTPRDLGAMSVGQCYYTPMVDETGGMLNDPVTLKLADDKYWVSIADSDLLFWVNGLAQGLNLQVSVTEPDVSPLAVQGPKSDALMRRVFGDVVMDIKFFRFLPLVFEGREMLVARSGYSKQGGYEIYLNGSDMGEALWDALFSAGADLQVRAGCPNLIERVEAGLLSYGNDMTRENTPHECGLGRFCDTKAAIGCIGRDALLRVSREGPLRMIRALSIKGDAVTPPSDVWPVYAAGERIGRVTSAVWSPDFQTNVAIGMVSREYWGEGSEVEVETSDGMRPAIVHEKSFI